MTTPRKKETFITRYAKNFEYLFKAMGFVPAIARGINKVIQTVFPPLANFFNGLSQLAKETTGPMKYVYQALNIAFIGLALFAAATGIPALLAAAGWVAAGLTAMSWIKNTVIPAIAARSAYLNTPVEDVETRHRLEEEYNQCKSDVAWGFLTVLSMSLLPLGTIAMIAASVALPVLPLVGLGGAGLLALTVGRAEIMNFVQQSAGLGATIPEAEEKATPQPVTEQRNENSQTSVLSSLVSVVSHTQSPVAKSSSPLPKEEKAESYSFSSFLSHLIPPLASKEPTAGSHPKQKTDNNRELKSENPTRSHK